jgi:hypothetical protein
VAGLGEDRRRAERHHAGLDRVFTMLVAPVAVLLAFDLLGVTLVPV